MKYYEDKDNKSIVYKVSKIGKSSYFWVTIYSNGFKVGKSRRKSEQEIESSGILDYKEVHGAISEDESKIDDSGKLELVKLNNNNDDNKIQEFFFNGVKVRGMMTNGEPWFVGKDVAHALGYKKPENAIINHVDDEDKTTTLIQGTGSNYKSKTNIINESGLYSLILSSKLEEAKIFKRWVTSEVLPSLRKSGVYNIQKKEWGVPQTFSEALKLASELQLQLEQQRPRVEFCDDVLVSETLLTITDIAKDYGMTGQQLNKILRENKIQFKKRLNDCTEPYKLYDEYAKMELARTITAPVFVDGKVIATNHILKWTEKGRIFIYDFLKRKGLTPIE